MTRSHKRFTITATIMVLLAGLFWLFLLSAWSRRLHVGRSLPPGKVTPQIISAQLVTVMIAPDGSLWCLGQSRVAPSPSPVIPGTTIVRPPSTNVPAVLHRIGSDTDWARIANGFGFLYGLKTDGSLWTWNIVTTPGLPYPLASAGAIAPVRVGADNDWSDIGSGMSHCLAIKKDGSLWAWGQNNHGQAGHPGGGWNETFIQIGSDHDWKTMSAGGFASFALKTNGTLWIWGMGPRGMGDDVSPRQLDPGTNWAAISAGEGHLVALKSDGTLWRRGYNPAGTYPDYLSSPDARMTPIGSDHDWSEIYSGEDRFFARKKNGGWWVCGRNTYGELGVQGPPGPIFTTTNPPVSRTTVSNRPPPPARPTTGQAALNLGRLRTLTPLPFGFDPWAFAPAGVNSRTSVLLTRDGVIWTWGMDLGTNQSNTISMLEFKQSVNRILSKLPGHKQPFSLVPTVGDPVPYHYWDLPPEVRQSLAKPAPPPPPH